MAESRPVILIADDEPNVRRTLGSTLKMEGYDAVPAANGSEAVQIATGGRPLDAVILDLQMPEMDGMEALRKIRSERPDLPVLMLTAHGSVERAVEAVRAGAYDFLEKPASTDHLLVRLANALKARDLTRENEDLRRQTCPEVEMVGESEAIEDLRATLSKVAPTESRVLITGENGTGKELVAQALHRGSARSGGPFYRVNCAAVAGSLFESELFGHEKGAFTGATRSRAGKFERAHGGTLFLDEIGEIPPELQPKLLRAIESGEIERVGGEGTRTVDVRLLAATNRDLEAMVGDGTFREDLFFRLNVVPVVVPPLRERATDVPLLVDHFVRRLVREQHLERRAFSAAALRRLELHSWPGNVRELRNLVERCLILAPGAGKISEASLLDVAPVLGREEGPPPGASLSERLETEERRMIRETCQAQGWNMTRAAEALGLERSHLYKKLKALGIERPETS